MALFMVATNNNNEAGDLPFWTFVLDASRLSRGHVYPGQAATADFPFGSTLPDIHLHLHLEYGRHGVSHC